jgi:hypothetical protein
MLIYTNNADQNSKSEAETARTPLLWELEVVRVIAVDEHVSLGLQSLVQYWLFCPQLKLSTC